METIESLNQKTLPGITPLFSDYLYDYGKVSDFYSGNPQDFYNYKKKYEEVSARSYSRETLVKVLREQNRLYGASEKTLSNISKLLDSKTCAIVSGQQVGIFGGPLFTFYKAIMAIKLAEKLNAENTCKVVPVFWLASDDHDLKEALSTFVITKENKVLPLNYDFSSITEGAPAAEVKFNPTITTLSETLLNELFDTEFKKDLQEKLNSCYSPEKDAATAFAQWMTVCLGKYGLIFINPADKRLKELGLPLFDRELKESSPSTNWVKEVNKNLEAKKYHQQLTLHENTFNLFVNENGRKSIKYDGKNIIVQGKNEKYSVKEFCDIAHSNPERISPNVVLRPLYQDTLLPTIAYVAGPNELSYFAQISAVYKGFQIPMPLIVPRVSITIVESKVKQILDKYQVSIAQVIANPDEVINQILKQNLPENLESDLEKMKKEWEQMASQLFSKIEKWEPTLVKAVESSGNSIKYQLDSLQKKILTAYKRKNDVLSQQIDRAINNIYPDRDFQERKLNIVPYLCKYGFAFIDDLFDSIHIENVDHQVLGIE